MIIELFKSGNFKNEMDRHLDASNQIKVTLNGKLRNTLNISNPVLIIDLTSNITGTNYDVTNFPTDYFNFNYARINELKRCYFIKDMTLCSNNLLIISLHVDVLCFRHFILNQYAFVTRNEDDSNPLLPDERRIITNEMIVREITPEKGDLVNTTFKTEFDYGTNIETTELNVVINAYQSGTTPISSISQYSSNHKKDLVLNNLPDKIQYAFNPCTSFTFAVGSYQMDKIINFVYGNTTAQSFIGNMYVFPFTIHENELQRDSSNPDTRYHNLAFIGGQNTETQACVILNKTSNELIVADFVLYDPSDEFEYLEPYSQYELYLPYYGWYKLPYNSLYGKRIIVFYVVNYNDGSAVVNVMNYTDGITIFSSTCQLGVEIGINKTNAQLVSDKNRQNISNLMLSLLASGISIGGGALTGNPVAVGMGLATGGVNIGKVLTNYNETKLTNYSNMVIALGGSIAPLFMYQDVKLRLTQRKILLPKTAQYLHVNGAPLNEFRSLFNVHGYTEISEIPNIWYYYRGSDVMPLENEINEILDVLRNGVVLP